MNTNFNLAEISEAIAAAIPDRECIVFRDRRYTWAQFNERTRRLANYLRSRGLGCPRTNAATLQNFESGQDHLGIYLYNCPEYLEAMVGAYKARVAPFNVNYRYVDDELDLPAERRRRARARLPRALRAERRSASAASCRSSRC